MRKLFRSAVLISLAAPMIAISCGGGSDVTDGDDLKGGSGGTGSVSGTGGSIFGPGGGSNVETCATNADCSTGQVCHPAALQCVNPGEDCEAHTDCATGQSCDVASSTCLPGLAGSACSSNDNCVAGMTCEVGVCSCSGFSQEQEETGGPLDIFFVLDRTGSMGQNCTYVHGNTPPRTSKACSAKYAVNNYLIDVEPATDTRLAFDFMSASAYESGDACDGARYADPLIPFTSLPVTENSDIVTAIANEDFGGGMDGTRIEDALRGIAAFTAANKTAGREMIGVLMTDGDPDSSCNDNPTQLAQIIADHLEATGIRTFIIGMEGASNTTLETLAAAGGAEPHDDYCGGGPTPCHYWNVGSGSGDAIADALQAIAQQATPLPCSYALADVTPAEGQTLDLSTLNVRLTESDSTSTIIARVGSKAACPADELAWYYDVPASPKTVNLCQNACDLVTNAAAGAKVNIVGGCEATVIYK